MAFAAANAALGTIDPQGTASFLDSSRSLAIGYPYSFDH
jgi:hypothetical protein